MTRPSSVGSSDIVTAFVQATDNIEAAFKVSDILRQHFVRSLDDAADNPGLTRTQSSRIQRAKEALQNIKNRSIESAEKDVLVALYQFGVVSIVSVAEQLLKSTFSNLLIGNLEVIAKPEKFTVNLSDLRDGGFKTDKRFWADQIIADLYGSKNAQEKLNFQNIKAIENLLRDYFSIDLNEFSRYKIIAQKIHLYYQIRHIISHNGGYVDERFLRNLSVAGISTELYPEGELIRVSKSDYDECREVFTDLFALIAVQVYRKNLSLENS